MRLFFGILTTLFTGYVMIMYESQWCMEFIVFEVLIILCSYIAAWRFKYAVEIDFSVKNNVVQKGRKISVLLTVKNKSFLPVQKLAVGVAIQREDNDASEHFKVHCAVDGHETTFVELLLESGYCGVVSVKANKIEVWDYLKLFRRKRKCGVASTIIVIPEIYPASVEVVSGFRYFIGESDVYSESESGDDPSEVFEIRDYRPGDKMQKIHWKLSARTDDLYVREYSEPVGFAVVLLLDYQGKKLDASVYDGLMSAAFSISSQLINEGYSHYIGWLDENGAWSRFRISSEDSIYIAMPYLLKSLGSRRISKDEKNSVQDVCALYNDNFGRSSYHTMVRIDHDLNVYKNDLLEKKLDVNHLKDDLLNINMEI